MPLLIDFFENGSYKLADDAREANRKKSSQRNQYDKEIIKVDERLNVEYMVFQGILLKIFPLPNDKNNKWFSPTKEGMKHFPPHQEKIVKFLIANYFYGGGKKHLKFLGGWEEGAEKSF